MNDESLLHDYGGQPALRVRVYLGERDRHEGQPLYTAIVQAARKAGLGGATVLKGIEGFGAHSVVHAARIVDMSSDLPIVVELIDTAERMRPFVALLRDMLDDGMMTIESVAVIYQDPGTKRS